MKTPALLLILMGSMSIGACTPGDPFGAEPKGVSPNCGPEHRYKYDLKIQSVPDFVDFLKQHGSELVDQHGNRWVKLDNFKFLSRNTNGAMAETPVNWEKVRNAVVTETVKGRTIYSLAYEPYMCPGQSFTLKMTNDGHVSFYGCCGN